MIHSAFASGETSPQIEQWMPDDWIRPPDMDEAEQEENLDRQLKIVAKAYGG